VTGHVAVRENRHVGPPMEPSLTPLEGTVDVLLRATYEVIEDERERGKVLDSKCAQLTGFIGVILALDATLAKDTLTNALGAPYSTLLPVLYFIAVVALTAGAISAVIGGVLPQKTLAFDREQFADFADGDIILSETVPVKQTLIECARNTRKATALQVASICLAAGVLAVGGQVATLGIRTLNSTMANDKQQQTKPAAPRPTPPRELKTTLVKKGGDKSNVEKRNR
jgi:hypothetical protein